jgi:hypothetical protein
MSVTHTFDVRRSGYQQGDHVCSLFFEPEEQLRIVVEYIKSGLSRGERCLFICCEHPAEDLRGALRVAGVNVDQEEKKGALLILSKEEGPLKSGCFAPDEMIDLLATSVEDALRDGFKGLCAAGDMNWAFGDAPGTHRLAEYEAHLNPFYETSHALGLCLYNLKKVSAQMLEDCLATHRYVRVDGPVLVENPFYEPEGRTNDGADPSSLSLKLDWLRRIRQQQG